MLQRARAAKKPWSNPTITSQNISTILSDICGANVESRPFPKRNLSSSSSPPPDDKQPPPPSFDSSTTQSTSNKERNASFQDFKRSLVRGQPTAAAAALAAYYRSGGQPSRPLYHSLMDLYSRKCDAESAVKILNTMIESSNPPPNQHSFGYAISALKKSAGAASTKNKATASTAAQHALQLFETMRSPRINLSPNATLYNELIDCFGKAGDLDQAFKLFHQAVAVDKIQPSSYTFSILIKSCAVARQPDKANDVVFKLMPQYKIQPTAAAWNGLLGATAAAAGGSVDRAYEVWQKMIDAGVVPDMHTERALAKAFASHPQLAAELVGEARSLAEESKKMKEQVVEREKDTFRNNITISSLHRRSEKASPNQQQQLSQQQLSQQPRQHQFSNSEPTTIFPTTPSKQLPILLDELQRKKHNVSAYALGLSPSFFGNAKEEEEEEEGPRQQQEGERDTEESRDTTTVPKSTSSRNNNFSTLLSLDLHGHSQAAAEMTLLCRLEALVEAWPELVRAQHVAQHATDTPTPTTTLDGLVIITGVGKNTQGGLGVLKSAVHAMLQKQGLTAIEVPNNPGRLFIPFDQISNFAEKQWERMQREHIYAAARARYGTVVVGVAGVVAAAVIIPRLGPWLV